MLGSRPSPELRRREILAEWKANQGERGAAGVPDVLRALEHIASLQVANVRDGDRLRLGAKQLRLAQHRALSQARRVRHGEPPRSVDVWWEQIAEIAQQWGIETKREDWEPKRVTAEGEDTGPRYSATEAA